MTSFNHSTESLDQKMYDVLSLLDRIHSEQDVVLVRLSLRVIKHALSGIKNDLDGCSNPKCSRSARVMAELRSARTS